MVLPSRRRTSPSEHRPCERRRASTAGVAIAVAMVAALGATGAATWSSIGTAPPPDAGSAEVARAVLASSAVHTGAIGRTALPAHLTASRMSAPDRTVVTDADGAWVATFTDGARTVAVAGPERRFDEPTARHGVVSTTWVRVLDAPFDGALDAGWLLAARQDTSADVLQTAMEYLQGAPAVVDDQGRPLAGEADYGPLQPDGTRPVGADWNDYQQVTAVYGSRLDRPEADEAGALDCSGYVRMLWGVRFGLPMSLRPDGGSSLPRRSFEQAAQAPGVTPIPDQGEHATADGRLQPGDLVFFDAEPESTRIDHVGMYLGIDEAGRHRFVSSRRSANGPTMGDHRGPSLLDGDGLYARTFVSSRRL